MQLHEQIARIEQWLGGEISGDYRTVLATNGGQLFGNRVLIYAADDVVERNETFNTNTYCPEFLTIGDDSGGRAFVIAPNISPTQVFAVDHGSMHPDDFEVISGNLLDWLHSGCLDS